MSYWPWWAGGASLAAVMVFHWIAVRRMMAVSGRFTALVNRLRAGEDDASDAPANAADQEALIAAVRQATAQEFGGAIPTASPADDPPSPPLTLRPQSAPIHVLFLVGLVAGGFLSALSSGHFAVTLGLAGRGFAALARSLAAPGALLLVGGGLCVGFGTRMASGCTSGHGLCGVSRLQKGSLLATATFFAVAVLVTLGLGAVR